MPRRVNISHERRRGEEKMGRRRDQEPRAEDQEPRERGIRQCAVEVVGLYRKEQLRDWRGSGRGWGENASD